MRSSRASSIGAQAIPMVGSRNLDRSLWPGTTTIGWVVVQVPAPAQPETSNVLLVRVLTGPTETPPTVAKSQSCASRSTNGASTCSSRSW